MAEKNRPVVVQYPGQGDTYEVASAKVAGDTHPDAKIVGYAGTFLPYGETNDEPVQQDIKGIPPVSVAGETDKKSSK